ncbi:class I SAM-dependent methyltransferase [Sphingomonas sp.]|uniref:class I SAM-dependent methyltransferase n=1 Tax=Sphingomonas sp. TaxID=28214 RepID=UPI00286B106F|nr:class I SAM-dependent methyltransferase [Sphingomonas sp.]
MASIDVRFSGSVPANYERYMVPLLFRPYAEVLAQRAVAFSPARILETAAGTGVVTDALAHALPDAEIVATDLNQAMLDVAAGRVTAANVLFKQADALDLPFDDGGFDLVVCQFGVMFYPDKVQGNLEARRVLRDGGRYLFAVWDSIERNLLSNLAHETLQRLFPENPPMFMKRGPFSYNDPQWIERDLAAAGFNNVHIETVALASRSPSAEEAARGLCYGSPMRVELELEEYGPDALDRTFAEVSRAARQFEGPDGFDAPMSAHIVVATK